MKKKTDYSQEIKKYIALLNAYTPGMTFKEYHKAIQAAWDLSASAMQRIHDSIYKGESK